MTNYKECPKCKGYGVIDVEHHSDHPYGDTTAREDHIDEVECPDCNGDGSVETDDEEEECNQSD